MTCLLNFIVKRKQLFLLKFQNILIMLIGRQDPEWGGGGTPLFGLYGDVPLDRVWFFGLAVLNRVYNLTCLCPKQGENLS